MTISPVFAAVGAILGVAGIALWLYWTATVEHMLWAGVLMMFSFFLIQCLVWLGSGTWIGSARWWKKQYKEPRNNREDNDDPRGNKYYSAIYAAILLAFVIGWQSFMMQFGMLYPDLPTGAIGWLIFTLIFLLGSISFILSPDGKKIVQAPVSRPLGLRRWVDLYASADPVPNGRTRTTEGGHESKRIWNLGSLLRDHTAYWDNQDGFVLRVARVCAETAESPWTHKLPDESGFVDKRAGWRVGFLQAARWISGFTWLALGVGVLLWNRNLANVPVPFNLPSWVSAPPVQHALFWALIALAMWATSSALCWIWRWWVLAEQEVVLGHDQPGREELAVGQLVIFFMALVVSMLIAAVVYVLFYVRSWADLGNRGGPGCLNNFSASISGASAGVRLPSGGAAVCSKLDRASCRQGSSAGVVYCKSRGSFRWTRGRR
jgi:hypothetical protein